METHFQKTKTREILKKVRQVEIRTKRQVSDALCGAYHSVFKGRGMDFEEVREYFIGDDVRAIDWNVTAKMDRPFVKLFREERELTLMILVDISASQNYGSTTATKREVAAELASLLAFSAIKNNDKVGLLLFSEKIEKFIPPKKGRHQVLKLIRDILFFEPTSTGTNLPLALDYLNRIHKRKSVVILISDFLSDDHPNILKNLELTNKRHDLICVRLIDPLEHTLPAKLGILTFEDAENSSQRFVSTFKNSSLEHYNRHNTERLRHFKSQLLQRDISLLDIHTDKPYIHPLYTFLNKRSAYA